MLKNSGRIKLLSFVSYLLGLGCLGLFIYQLVVLKGKYNDNLAMLIGLGVGVFSFLLIGLTLSPLKIFKRTNLILIAGILLCFFAGLTLGFMVYDIVKAYDLKTLLICIAVAVVSAGFGMHLLMVAKQDINIEARDNKEEKEKLQVQAEERASLTKCPYCGCRITAKDKKCPNCKSKI